MDSLLQVGVIGMNFKTADLTLREAVARSTMGLVGEAGRFFPHPTVIVSTCNRSEIYFSAEDLAAAHSDLLHFLGREGLESSTQRFYSYFGIDCLSHLSRVTAGLDSAIIAETEIQRQVKCSYQAAAKQSVLPGEMHFLFQKALHVGKEIRTALPEIRGGAAIFAVIWDLISAFGLNRQELPMLFVGYSQMNRELAFFLKEKEMKRAHFCTRTPDTLRARIGFEKERAVYGRDILAAWERYRLIFCASPSFEYLLQDKEIGAQRRLIFDLSVPRAVDPAIGKHPETALYNIEQLDRLAGEKYDGQQELLRYCEELVKLHALRLYASLKKRRCARVKIQHVQGCAERE